MTNMPSLEQQVAELTEKVNMYEGVLHDIQMYREVVLINERVIRLLDNIGRWSYAHRRGNGELDNEPLIRRSFLRLRDVNTKD